MVRLKARGKRREEGNVDSGDAMPWFGAKRDDRADVSKKERRRSGRQNIGERTGGH